MSGVCMIHCLEGESDPDESEGFSAESLAVVPRQSCRLVGCGPDLVCRWLVVVASYLLVQCFLKM